MSNLGNNATRIEDFEADEKLNISAKSTSMESSNTNAENTDNEDQYLNNVASDENANRNVNETVVQAENQPPTLNSIVDNLHKELMKGSVNGDSIKDEESEEISCLSSNDEESSGGDESDLEDNTDPEGCVEYESSMNNLPNSNYSLPLRQRQINPILPETVTLLETSDGSKVYLVGTAHFSVESQEDVAATIQATQPDIVMVELCKSRVNVLALDEKTILQESKNLNLEKMRTALKQNGVVQGLMYLLLLSMSAHITKQLGMAPGGEFRRAFSEARNVPGCLLHLGDRPIQITLRRALSSLSFWQKMRLAWYLVTSKQPISKEDVEKCKRRDLLEQLMAEMTGEFPALSTVFVSERDTFLAYSLRLAAMPVPSADAPNGISPRVVVGVVGIGHVSGIVQKWDIVTEADIPSILSIPEPSTTSVVLRKTMRYSLLGLAFWGCYRLLAPRVNLAAIYPKRSIEWLTGLLQR